MGTYQARSTHTVQSAYFKITKYSVANVVGSKPNQPELTTCAGTSPVIKVYATCSGFLPG